MATATSPSNITVVWGEVDPIDQNGIITEYQVLYQRLDTLTGVTGTEMMERVSSMETSVVLSGLDESAFYVISVRARTTEGEGPSSDYIFVKTMQHGSTLSLLSSYMYIEMLQLLPHSSHCTTHQCQRKCHISKQHHSRVGGGGSHRPEWHHH